MNKILEFFNRSISSSSYLSLGRIKFILFCLTFYILFLVGRLVSYNFGTVPKFSAVEYLLKDVSSRPDIIDRKGRLLAGDIETFSLYANPRDILDTNEVIELLTTVLPNLNVSLLKQRLNSKSTFIWIERGLTPKQKRALLGLGIPGLGFRQEIKRIYPAGNITSHIVGIVDVDNIGLSGLEKYIDNSGLNVLRERGLIDADQLTPLKISLDLVVQTKVHDILSKSMEKFSAKAAGALILDIKTGEVISAVSLPDFDPLNMKQSLQPERLNRLVSGVYEVGSIVKSFTTAMILEHSNYGLNSIFDASKPLSFGKQSINDYHGKYRPLKVWEIFLFSSNIGSALEARAVGIEYQKSFFKKLGLLDRLITELPESAAPLYPRQWKEVNAATISFGHGLATTPLQIVASEATLMNNGISVPPTFLFRDKEEAQLLEQQIISTETSQKMRYLSWLNGTYGSGKLARVLGYRVGGKTGTAEKVENGKYQASKRLNTYLASFPIDNPKYVILTLIDEPQIVPPDPSAVAAYNAGRMAAEIIRAVAFELGVKPDFSLEGRAPYLLEKDKPR